MSANDWTKIKVVFTWAIFAAKLCANAVVDLLVLLTLGDTTQIELASLIREY